MKSRYIEILKNPPKCEGECQGHRSRASGKSMEEIVGGRRIICSPRWGKGWMSNVGKGQSVTRVKSEGLFPSITMGESVGFLSSFETDPKALRVKAGKSNH